MEYGILGSIAVWDGGRELPLGGGKQRALLAALLLRANELVPTSRLVDDLWGERPPPTAVKTVQVYVSQLRKTLGESAIETRAPGYLLRLEPGALDAQRFEELLGRGRGLLAAGAADDAGSLLREALALWRGPALADFQYETFARDSIARLEELRLVGLEQRLEADLALGRHAQAVAELETLVREHPHRESIRRLLMLALYRSGRQADALAAYQDGRQTLVDELGLEPSQELQRLEKAILVQDAALDLPASPAPSAPPPPPAAAPPRVAELLACPRCGRSNPPDARFCHSCGTSLEPEEPSPARKTVTVLFCDAGASSEVGERVDPESLRALQSRYFDQAAAVLERHGGTVEKLIGDQLMAVFGVPFVHEDDALRAVRAAAELAEGVTRLGSEQEAGLQIRIGISTGEVVAGGAASGHDFVTGEAVIVGKRLEEAAGAGEVLLDDETHAIVAHAVEAGQLDPIEVRGLRGPVAAFRLVGVNPGAPALPRRDDAPLVNRQAELARLESLYHEVATGAGARLVTLVGEPGIGKSRLVRELLTRVGKGASVHVGRCPPYGEGITFLPLQGLLPTDELSGSSREIFAATRHVLVELARRRPVVVAFEDVHWAEPTFLDLVEYLAGRLGDARVLIVCLARPDLAERRPAWLRDAIALEPLTGAESEQLLDELGVGEALRPRIAEAAEGNPLFVEQLAAIAESEMPLPASIRGVLAARLDRLGRGERTIIERAAVVGRDFSVSSIADLSPPEHADEVTALLLELARKGLVRPDPSSPEEGYRFQHALIRDAAYEGTPRATRAELHERVAERLETADADEALVGYHLEHAYLCLEALGDDEARAAAVAKRAAERLESAGRHALDRSDVPAAIGLLERAAKLLAEGDPERVALLPDLGAAMIECGRLDEAERILEQAGEAAASARDERAEARVLVQEQFLRLQRAAGEGTRDTAGVLERVIPVFERHQDDHGLCSAHKLQASSLWTEAQAAAAAGAWQRAAAFARRAGDRHELTEILSWIASSHFFGPVPVDEGIRLCEEIRSEVSGTRAAEAAALRPLAGLYAMAGRFEDARELLAEASAVFEDLGLTLNSAVSHHEAIVELLAGDYAAAEERLRSGYLALEEMREKTLLSTTAAFLAQACFAQGKDVEAERYCALSAELGAQGDALTQTILRSVRARLLAKAGRVEEAEGYMEAALALIGRTDFLNQHADALSDLAEILSDAGRIEDAGRAADESLRLYEQKGNVVSMRKAEVRVAELAGV